MPILTSTTVASTRRPSRPGASHSPLLLTVLLTALFMNLVDISVVNVALGELRHDLHASGAQLQLVVSGYVLAYAVLLVTGARLGDRVGHRRVFRWGVVAFTLASLACGLATGSGTLVGLRFAQGIGAAAMLPQVMSLVQRTYTAGPARARALGWYGLVLALGTVAGQIIGGVLLQLDVAGLGWRVAFLVNVPVGGWLWIAAGRHLPTGTAHQEPRGSDLPGVLLAGATVGLVVVPLVLGREQGWPAWTWVCLGGAVVTGVALAVVERAADRAGAGPILPADVLHAPGLLAGLLVLLLTIGGYAGYLFMLSLHLQQHLGLGPLATGLTFLPLAVGFAAAALLSPRLPRHVAHRLVPIGLLVCVAAFPALGLLLAGGGRPGLACLTVLFVLGAGQGLAVTPVMTLALARVPMHRAGEASGVLATTFQVAQVLGVAGLGAVYLSHAGGPATVSAGAVQLVCLLLAGTSGIAALAALRLVRPATG